MRTTFRYYAVRGYRLQYRRHRPTPRKRSASPPTRIRSAASWISALRIFKRAMSYGGVEEPSSLPRPVASLANATGSAAHLGYYCRSVQSTGTALYQRHGQEVYRPTLQTVSKTRRNNSVSRSCYAAKPSILSGHRSSILTGFARKSSIPALLHFSREKDVHAAERSAVAGRAESM